MKTLVVALMLFFTQEMLMSQTLNTEKSVSILYTNWRGETGERLIVPENLFFGSTEWHKEPQWLLHAYDVEKQAYRDFAIKDIAGWKPATP